jgi:hypothetical protein
LLLRAISLTLLLTTSVALADDMKTPLNAKDLKWGPAPNVFPKGAQIAIVSGDSQGLQNSCAQSSHE